MATFTVSNLNDSGLGSLRAAIAAANSSGSPAVIDFSINGVITIASDLPSISNTVTIDATTAPGYISGGAPVVEVDCNSHAGLVFAIGSGASELLGLAVGNATGNGVTLNASLITLNNNYIGLDLAGAALGNSGDGVFVSTISSNNQIGLNASNASGVVGNVISGNAGNGISLHGSSGNTIVANRIGTDPTGTAAIANGGNGIWVTAASNNNVIGGTVFVDSGTGDTNNPTGSKGTVTPVFVVPPLGNLVSGNSQTGVLIDTGSRNNVLNGNFIGTTADGNTALGNAADGVWINGADNNSLIGCQFVNDPFVYYNVVSGNAGNGLHVSSSDNVTVQANFFGAGANNTNIVANAGDGILVDGTSQNTQVGGVIPLGNVSAGNGMNGIEVRDTVGGFTTFNTFGGLLAFKGAAANGNDGLLITATGGNQTVQTNVFSGNTNNGIEIAGNASGVTVDPNIVGLNTVGNAVLPNGGDGLLIGGTAHDNIIGGYQASVIPQNTFSGNVGYGIAIMDGANNNQVFNGHVGLSSTGIAALGNLAGGIFVGGTANNNVIGGTTTDPATAIVVSGNTGTAITLATGTSSNQLLGNAIGVDRFGLPILPNTADAIVVDGSAGNTVSGGTGKATIFGGSGGNNMLFAGPGQTTIVGGGNGDQLIAAGAAGDQLYGGAGNETLSGSNGGGSDVLVAGSGNALMFGGTGANTIAGGSGASTVVAGTGASTVFAGSGPMLLFGGAGALLFAGGANGGSTVVGGTGVATLFGSSGGHNMLFGGTGAATMVGGGSGDQLIGGGTAGNQLFAGAGNETLAGSALGGNDLLMAGTGTDVLFAGSGSDTIVAGTGNAQMVAGSGPGLFVFSNGLAGGSDIIWNFTHGLDHVLLANYSANAVPTALASAVTSGGSTTITLSDHTVITFGGVTQLVASDFV
jgi:parallel beta-helix repeat protein